MRIDWTPDREAWRPTANPYFRESGPLVVHSNVSPGYLTAPIGS